MTNRCVMCGAVIPEGTQVCYSCANSNNIDIDIPDQTEIPEVSLKVYRFISLSFALILLIGISLLVCAVVSVPLFIWIIGATGIGILVWEIPAFILVVGYFIFVEFWKRTVKAVLADSEV